MYKLPEHVKDSTVYAGFKIAVGWKTIRKFFTSLSKDGYFVHRMRNSYSSSDGYTITADFIKDGKLFRVKSRWIRNGSRNLLREKYRLDLLEITDAPLQN